VHPHPDPDYHQSLIIVTSHSIVHYFLSYPVDWQTDKHMAKT